MSLFDRFIQRLRNLCLSLRDLREESIEPFGDHSTKPLSVPEKMLSFVFGILRWGFASYYLFLFLLQTLIHGPCDRDLTKFTFRDRVGVAPIGNHTQSMS